MVIQDLRNSPRFFLNPPVQGLANGTTARIVDVGPGGLRLELRRMIEPGSPVEVSFGAVRIRGTVLWCQVDALNFASDYDYYLAGVAFDAPSDDLEDFAEVLCTRGEAIRITELRAHDRYRITAPLTGSFGAIAPVSIIDVSVRGARIAMLEHVEAGVKAKLRFQIDELTGPVSVEGTVAWCNPSPVMREFYAGLNIQGHDERLRTVIETMCVRNEARIDMDSLKRKFDALRLATRVTENPQRLAV